MRRLLTLVFLLLAPVSAAPQPPSEASSARARAAQFVLVIDDSGSMERTDPDRLAVFAAQALLSILDDRDEVSVVRLNAPGDAEPLPPIEPLAKNRQRLKDLLGLGGRLAAYGGSNTTCRSALEGARRLLNAAYRPNVAQVVLFLTDGECTPPSERPSPAPFLEDLRSHADELFQLYLLRFRGEDVSPELVSLAQATGGDTIEIGSADPTAILHAFATALSRSQGYEADLLTPGDAEVEAHRGARRIRLLAVAPGEKPPLRLAIHDYQGRQALALGQPRTGVHRFPGRRAFRYVALDYRPGTEPVTVEVTGAAQGWKVVAVPEYRLALAMKILEGSCAGGGRPVAGGIETGATACLVLDLVNEAGAVVSGDALGQELEAVVRMRRAGEPADKAVELPAQPVGGRARFHLQRDRLEPGDWVYQPLVRLSFGGLAAKVALRGRQQLLTVASSTVTPVPGRLTFGRVRPGEEVTQSLTFAGNFQSTPARIELSDRKDVPSCVTFELSGKGEGIAQPITVGQAYTLVLRVAPYCGPRSRELPLSTRLRLAFAPAPGARFLPDAEIPVELTLVDRIEPPREVTLRMRGGETAEVPVPIGGNRQRDLAARAILADTEESARWHGDELALTFGGAPEGGAPEDHAAGKRRFTLPRAGGAPLRLMARAESCCPAGTYHTELGLAPAGAAGYAPGAPPPEPLVIPVRIEVASAGFLACWLPRILAALGVLLLVALAVYVASMVRHSHFLSARRVAEKLVPLVWTTSGGTVEQKGSREAVLQMVGRGLRWPARVQAWLKANPLAFGLKGGSYRETLELNLQPQRDNSWAGLLPERSFLERLKRDPESYRARLFAVAHGSVTFLAVADPSQRICQMTLDGVHRPAPRPGGGPGQPEAVTLRGQRLLRQPERWERKDGLPAGWRVG